MSTTPLRADPMESRRRVALQMAVHAANWSADQAPSDLAQRVICVARSFEAYLDDTIEVLADPIGPLSRQQARVLDLLADGLTIAACAHRMQVSESTVKTYVSLAMKRLKATSRIEAILTAHRLGLINHHTTEARP